ncbi:MAG: polarity establishment/cellular polarization, partial [Massilia sp.]|nr:polarity establishment/cellular polarization [Massilia sp.]
MAAGDVVGVPVDIVATDDSGSVTMTAILVVSRKPPPTVSIPLTAQTPDFAPFSQPSSIIMSPDTSFAFTLASNTFIGASIYYAVMADNSPLPSWMVFDPAKLSFSGRTPPLSSLVQTPQSFDFQLVGSDVPGFSAASLPFSLVIGNHAVTAIQSFITLNATVGEHMSYNGLAGSV